MRSQCMTSSTGRRRSNGYCGASLYNALKSIRNYLTTKLPFPPKIPSEICTSPSYSSLKITMCSHLAPLELVSPLIALNCLPLDYQTLTSTFPWPSQRRPEPTKPRTRLTARWRRGERVTMGHQSARSASSSSMISTCPRRKPMELSHHLS